MRHPVLLLSLPLLFLTLPPLAEAVRPPAGTNVEAPETPRAQATLSYRTKADLLLSGLVAGTSVDKAEAIPEEISVRAGTRFRILDRRINDDEDYFTLLELQATEGTLEQNVAFWLDEHELVKALYGVEPANEETRLNLDTVSPAYARFEFEGAVDTAGPEGFIIPIKGARRTSPPGMRMHPILKKWKMHAGWDFAAPTGTPVMAAAAGKVSQAGPLGGYGNVIYLDHGRIETRYAHLSKILVKVKQPVAQAQVIGKVGTTGRSTGPHLHYERRGPNGEILDVPPGRR